MNKVKSLDRLVYVNHIIFPLILMKKATMDSFNLPSRSLATISGTAVGLMGVTFLTTIIIQPLKFIIFPSIKFAMVNLFLMIFFATWFVGFV